MNKEYSILIIDDEQSQREVLKGFLEKKNYKVITASSGNEGLELINQEQVDIVLSDYKMPDKTGIEVLEEVKRINPEISFVLMTAYGTIENAVKAMRLGAYDYLSKPIDLEELELLLGKIIENKSLKSEVNFLRQQLQEKFKIDSFVSTSPKMQEVLSVAARAAESKATVLITGESGTGKEVLAKSIHYISTRKDKPFVAVNVPALPETLLESELFGHEKGAFTGADKTRMGRFELANKGTIFLDEIGDIPMNLQVKLLRVLQEHKIERLGSNESIDVDVRVIAATHQNLEQKIKDGTFREDLFYRLNVISIHIPPLRERKEDIMPLIEHFIKKYAQENDKPNLEISKEAVDYLMKYNYPGNVRELENIIERAVVLSRQNIITVNDLPSNVKGFKTETDPIFDEEKTLTEQVEALEKKLIYDALTKANGNQSLAGRMLGITERNLRYKMQKYGIKKFNG
ncbi:MAG: sigma-54 dependent transcriptional regulator [Ignavibacterium sp.]|jgi:two-component system NtrC family response regulator|uniref:Sigma-54-dependent Fis family transcriptional regulator n=1 Tax=Ignavibacterium album TaxID=591197 RepID=A0A7V2ZHD2_9BACT|nr:sigma-54 dependent transcriptional regulator [Ignavibacterium album]MCA2004869.1 sigma-54 dependent transcriptional regulator [Ignavibacterium sp.]MCX8106679.1 sigma-54 dependent transcriptional regulator [Ignavibacterium album]